LIKTGQLGLDGNDLEDDTTTIKKRKVNRYPGYTDAVWGAKTRGWAASAARLEEDENKWKSILQAAVEKMDLSGAQADEGEVEDFKGRNGGVLDPRALIEI
jgi:hypothetical protein